MCKCQIHKVGKQCALVAAMSLCTLSAYMKMWFVEDTHFPVLLGRFLFVSFWVMSLVLKSFKSTTLSLLLKVEDNSFRVSHHQKLSMLKHLLC